MRLHIRPTVDTKNFVASHGKQPSGLGNWEFRFGAMPGFMANGTWSPSSKKLVYKDARREAVGHAHEIGLAFIEVCP